MAGITQTIPNYVFGESNQPEELKIPGFVKEAVNIYPDITEGCEKRPGSKYISDIKNIDGSRQCWFFMRDAHDPTGGFVGRAGRDGTLKLWDVRTGERQTVKARRRFGETADPFDYLKHIDTGQLELSALPINDSVYIVNKTTRVALDATQPAVPRPPEAFISLKSIAYNQQYPLDIASAQEKVESTKITSAVKLKAHWISGGNRGGAKDLYIHDDESCPFNATKIFTINPSGDDKPTTDIDTGEPICPDATNLRFRLTMHGVPFIAGYHGSRNGEPYHWAKYTLDLELMHGGEGWEKGDTFVIEMGGEHAKGKEREEYRITVESIQKTEVTADLAVVRPEPTTAEASENITAASILHSIEKQIEKENSDLKVRRIGSGLYITPKDGTPSDKPFTVSTSEPQLLSIIGFETGTAASLPSECLDGYIVRVRNSGAEEDDYWLRFEGKKPMVPFTSIHVPLSDGETVFGPDGLDGEGTWVECEGPINHDGRVIHHKIAKETWPHELIKEQDPSTGENTFYLQQANWADRKTGDNLTNPKPWFLKGADKTPFISQTGTQITGLLFWRNRLVILSKNYVCLSQPGDFFNVWAVSATTTTPQDAIDVSTTSGHPSTLYTGIEVNQGLIISSKDEQFMLTTDSDILSGDTVKVSHISSYSVNTNTPPINLGNSIAFTDNAGRHTRLYEMSNITREGHPNVVELSKPVTENIPTGIDSIACSRENGLVVLTNYVPWTEESPADPFNSTGLLKHCPNPYDYVYCYKYFTSGNKRIQSAWFKWQFPGRVLWHTILNDTYYFILDAGYANGQKNFRLLRMELVRKYQSMNWVDAANCKQHNVHLDNMITLSGGVYSGGKTRWTVPQSLYNSLLHQTGAVISPDTMSEKKIWISITDTDDIRYANGLEGTTSRAMVEQQGDFSGMDVTVGIGFEMKLELPQIYLTKASGDSYRADTSSTLTIHRCNFNFSLTGPVETIIEFKDTNRLNAGGLRYPHDQYDYNQNAHGILENYIIDDSIFALNKDFKIIIKSINPHPCTFTSMTWEGDYNSLYKRV